MNHDKVIDTIRKLFALARGNNNEAESEAALAKASQLMLKHGIEEIGDADSGPKTVFGNYMGYVIKPGNRHEKVVYAAVAKLYSCRTVVSKRKNGGELLQFVGTLANIAACEETFMYIIEQLDVKYKLALKAYRAELGRSLTQLERDAFWPTFKSAAAIILYNRVEKIVNANKVPERALMVIDQLVAAADEAVLADGGFRISSLAPYKIGIGTGAGEVAGSQIKLQQEVVREE